MKFILVLEDDESILNQLFETIKGIDPQLQIRIFKGLAEFHEWLKLAMIEGPLSLAHAGVLHAKETDPAPAAAADDQLRLVIAKNEFLGVKQMNLIRRAKEFFLRKKLCSLEEPTALILTAFDSPTFDILLAEERIINNVIFKPFDKLILKQHLEFALEGHHPLDGETISTIEVQDKIEMLKRTQFHSFSELGFTTTNNHEIKLGAITKYYAGVFQTPLRKGIFATCVGSQKINDSEFVCEFHFFAADKEQISQARREILKEKTAQKSLLKAAAPKPLKVLLLEEKETTSLEIKHLLEEYFANLEIFAYTSQGQMLSDLADKDTAQRKTLPPRFDMIFASLDFFAEEKEKAWAAMGTFITERYDRLNVPEKDLPDLYLTTNKKLSVEQCRPYLGWCREVFFLPVDRSYLPKKLLSQQTHLQPLQALEVVSRTYPETLKIANTVDITQISEAGLVMKYYRAIGLGSFREFLLLRTNELESPEILGTCNYTVEQRDPKQSVFMNHFVFFGMTDHFLKHIRLWLREAYVRSKETAE